ncbi:MAG: hypothetical protein UHY90_06460 [Treponema sp.]|nr:hypothetical protein [Spirochaetia bacterium]MDD7460291.1 hypothetical protein [Spirochaetales bacterium]MDY5810502.1 hypothetical protein [Treponema sp.]MEE1181879.1 hypothetical protein [Treponema sp.]
MTEDLKKQIASKQDGYSFIKVTDNPVNGLSDQQKVALNRKANALFNEGKLEMAERIFVTTGYSDGLSRVGDKYAEKNLYFKALKLYLLAHNKRKSEPIIEKISQTVSVLLKSN